MLSLQILWELESMVAKAVKGLSAEDLWRIERIATPEISPCGRKAVFSVTRYDMNSNVGRSNLYWVDLASNKASEKPQALTSAGDRDASPQWSPNGDRIAFVAKREQSGVKDEAAQLYVIAAHGGEAKRLTQWPLGVGAFRWMPDGKRIVFISWVWPEQKTTRAQIKRHIQETKRKDSAQTTSASTYRFWDHFIPQGRVPRLMMLDISRGTISDLMAKTAWALPLADPGLQCFDLSPDGKHAVFCFDPEPEPRLDYPHALALLDLKTGKAKRITPQDGWDYSAPVFNPEGSSIACLASDLKTKHTMPARLTLLSLKSGAKPQPLMDRWDRVPQAPLRWAANGREIYFTAEDCGRCHLWRYSFSDQPESVVQGGWVQSFAISSAQTPSILVSIERADHPAQLYLHQAREPARRLDRFNDALLNRRRLGRVEAIEIKGALDQPVQVWVTYPPDFDPKKTYPLLHNIHGGPHTAAGDNFHYRWNTQVFAAQGYVVASVNYHGSSSFGYEFLDSITHRWGELELIDIEAATSWFESQPYIDPQRIVAAGGSYGGYMVAWMNAFAKADRYKAYICHAGCFDWVGMFADDAYGWHAQELGAWYWNDMQKVLRQSPHHAASAMSTPTLVIHGALDYRVPDAQGLAYYNTLKAKGVEARLLWFPDENHWILKPQNSLVWYREFFNWLTRYAPASIAPKRSTSIKAQVR